jgi:hypothetical protein
MRRRVGRVKCNYNDESSQDYERALIASATKGKSLDKIEIVKEVYNRVVVEICHK